MKGLLTLRGTVNERSCGSKGLTRTNHNKRASSRNVHRPTGLKSPKSRYLLTKDFSNCMTSTVTVPTGGFWEEHKECPPAPQKEVTCNRFSGRFSQNEPHLHGHVHRHFLSRAASWMGNFQHSNHWAKGWVRMHHWRLSPRKELSGTPEAKYWYHKEMGGNVASSINNTQQTL